MLFYRPTLLIPLFLSLLVACAMQHAKGQERISNFRLYTVKDGLASNYIKNLLLDSKGFLWVGTLEGINRFDGTSFNNLQPAANEFTEKDVECMTQVNDSLILIGTPSGLLVFDLNKNRFQSHCITDPQLKAGTGERVNSIISLPQGRCLVSAGNYMLLLNRELAVVRKKKVTDFYKNAYLIP